MSEYPVAVEVDHFTDARHTFETLIIKVSSSKMLSVEHGEVEGLIDSAGRDVLRQVLQGHLSTRTSVEEEAARATRPVAVGADHVERRRRRKASRQLLSLFGFVVVHRLSLSMPSTPALQPLDAALNLPTNLYSHGVRRAILEEVAGTSYDSSISALGTLLGLTLAKRQVEAAVVHALQDFNIFYDARAGIAAREGSLVVLTFDGKGVVMREDGLRPETRKAAQRATPKVEGRISPGEKSNRKRMAEVAAVYTVLPYYRTTDQVFKDEGCGPISPRPRVQDKRVWGSLELSASQVIHHAFDEALQRDPSLLRDWAVLVDGNAHQISVAKAAAASMGKEVTLILDIVHAVEYIWTAAWSLFEKGDGCAADWVKHRVKGLLDGKVSYVAAGIRSSATRRKLTGNKRNAMDKCADYLLGHKHMMRYDLYLKQGLPIGTGVIEGACRHLVKDRMDITGARWGLPGAEAVLRLRALRSSGDLDAYWDFHKRKELERNHLNHYDETELLEIRKAA
jgi:hypothetical protein